MIYIERYNELTTKIKESIPSEEPPYVEFTANGWELTKVIVPAAVGYFSWGPISLDEPVWVLKRDGQVWMSNSPRELESMEYAIYRAKGTVIIGGLGMGWVAWKCALKDSVNKVIVIENDAKLIEMFPRMVNGKKIPFTIHEGDIFDTGLDDLEVDEVDFMFLDIWPEISADCIPVESKRIWKNIPAKEVNYWGQETDIGFRGFEKNIYGEGGKIDLPHLVNAWLGIKKNRHFQNVLDKMQQQCVDEYIESVNVPLSGEDETGYAALCAVVMANSIMEKVGMNDSLYLGIKLTL